jgi:hypothetical protein
MDHGVLLQFGMAASYVIGERLFAVHLLWRYETPAVTYRFILPHYNS